MTEPRLFHAIETGAVTLPEGRLAIFGPPTGLVLPAPPEAAQVITSDRPIHDHYAARGYDCTRAPSGDFAGAVVFVPRARERARARIAAAAALGGPVLIDGDRTNGVDALMRELRDLIPIDGLSKAHGRVLWFDPVDPAALPGWSTAADPREVDGWQLPPGAFSSDGPDPGSVALLDALPPLKGGVADLGAGWGYLARGILAASPAVTDLTLIEADADALDCARSNVADPRARFHWSDATQAIPGAPFDTIVTNPPFHTSRAADPGLGQAFIDAAARALTAQGTLWLVANRHLPYESHLSEAFSSVETLPGPAAYKLFRATRPISSKSRTRTAGPTVSRSARGRRR